MPGTPVRRARREAEKRLRELMVENPAQAMAEMAEDYAPAPPLSDEDRVRVGATHELYRTVLDGAQDALKLLRDGMNGTARGRDLRDLAVTAQALLRAAREMEKHAPPDEPPSLAELEAAEAEAARIYAARKGRG